MRIGLTYDLRSEYLAMGYSEEETAEFDRDDTIVAIEAALSSLGHETDRIGNARKLTERLVAGDRWDLVFNIAEGLSGLSRESQVPAILDLYDIPYTFSDPLITGLTLHKGMTKQLLRQAGFLTPDFAVISSSADLAGILFDPPYFVKPVAEGTGKGIDAKSVVSKRKDLKKACTRLMDRFLQPVLVERFLPGREFTTGILGTGEAAEVLGTLEVILLSEAEQNVYSYHNKENCESLVKYRLATPENDPVAAAAESLALGVWRYLGCRDAGRIDLRCDAAGAPNFIEVNPLAGLHPEHSDLPIICNHLHLPYLRLIERIVESAAVRVDSAEIRNKPRARRHCS
jgi:D-alanine-D-alanine ligase